MSDFLKKSATAFFCQAAFFLLLLLAGLFVYKDYGVHLDEYTNQWLGEENWNYVNQIIRNHSLSQTPPLNLHSHFLTHGPFVELLLTCVKHGLNLKQSRDVLWMRHLGCFLMFYLGVWAFFNLCKLYFNDWKIALLGSLFLVLSPRIFGFSFYDTYDIPFLSFYIMGMYTLVRWLKDRTFSNAAIHALACAILIDTRPIGIVLPFYTFILLVMDGLRFEPWQLGMARLWQVCLYLVLLAVLTVAGWPLLWPHPILNFMAVINENSNFHYPFPYTTLFMGHAYWQYELPWYYLPVWILISTPVLYSFYFIFGCYVVFKSIFKNVIFFQRKYSVLSLLCFLFPILLAHGKVYDTWRHLFFVYPAFLVISLVGLVFLWDHQWPNFWQKVIKAALVVLTVISISCTLKFMIQHHPLENVYFSSLAGKDMKDVKKRFVLDFWGVPYKQALELILKKDNDRVIDVSSGVDFESFIGNNLNILDPKDRRRFNQTKIEDAKYFITNYLWHPAEYPYPLYASIKIGGANILGIYKLR